MNDSKLYLINQIFKNKTIRTIWNKEKEKYYISVVDIVALLTDSSNPRHYWNVLKGRLKDEGNETVTNCDQLKLKASDGKYRLTDVVDIEEMFRIIESIPSKNAEPIKRWLARLGSERIDETFDPSIAINRALDTYRLKGYDDDWIDKRIKAINNRHKLTELWQNGGITSNIQYALLTNEIYKEWSGMTTKKYKAYKGLKKESLRDNMTDIELLLADLSELATKEILKKEKPFGLKENIKVAKRGGKVANISKKALEKEINGPVISRQNNLPKKHKKVGKLPLK